MVVRHLRCHLPAQGPWLSRAPADKDSSAPGSHLCPWSADPTSEPRAAEGRPMLTCLASALGPPWTSDGPARSLPHAFGSHLPPSPSHTMPSTVSRCTGPCPEPRGRTESRNNWDGHVLARPGMAPRKDHRIQTSKNPLGYCHLVQLLRRSRGIER